MFDLSLQFSLSLPFGTKTKKQKTRVLICNNYGYLSQSSKSSAWRSEFATDSIVISEKPLEYIAGVTL